MGTRTAILVGLVLSTSLPAHEALVGNLWAIRWTLLSAACVIASIPSFSNKFWRTTLVLFLATGLSHAYIFIPTIIYFLQAFLKRDYRTRTLMLGSGLVFSTLFQVFGYLNSSRQFKLYGESAVYWAWAVSGVFWWAIFTIPLAFALIAVLPNLRMLFRDFTPQSSLAVQAVLISVLTYLQLGVKSSPVVATVTVSFAAVIVGKYKPNSHLNGLRINSLIQTSCSIILFVLSVRFFYPSFFLTNGIGWP